MRRINRIAAQAAARLARERGNSRGGVVGMHQRWHAPEPEAEATLTPEPEETDKSVVHGRRTYESQRECEIVAKKARVSPKTAERIATVNKIAEELGDTSIPEALKEGKLSAREAERLARAKQQERVERDQAGQIVNASAKPPRQPWCCGGTSPISPGSRIFRVTFL